MSKDIRSFFLPKKTEKTKHEDDSDIIPESPDVNIKIKKREIRKKRILSDSDEEKFSSKKKKSSTDGKVSSHNMPKYKSPVKKELKEVKAVDIFGTKPIKRSKPIVRNVKTKTESDIHADDKFEQSLVQLDEITVKYRTKTENQVPNALKQEDSSDETNKVNLEIKSTKIKNINVNKKHDAHISKNNKTDEDVKDSKKLKNNINSSAKQQVCELPSEIDIIEIEGKDIPETSLNDSVLADEERYERKRQSAALYQKYLNRSGPKHLGAKEIPEGAPNCLKDCAFLLTGVLDSFEREEVADAITKLGGVIKNSISKKVTHVLAGEDAGPAKIAKAQQAGIKILNEDEFLEFIINKSTEQKSVQLNIKDDKENQKITKSKKINNTTPSDKNHKSHRKNIITTKKEKHEINFKEETENCKTKMATHNNNKSVEGDKKESNTTKSEGISKLLSVPTTKNLNDLNIPSSGKLHDNFQATMWVEKYKPQTLKQIIGQHGESSNVKKLCNWLTKWYVNRKAKLPKPSPWAKNVDGGYYKAALLSGPPGVGKTTTVSLVCKELGFDMVEFNASDTRNKSLIKEQIGELLTTTSLSGYARGLTGKQAVSKKHVLVMDEVDGMAGNEDRGGLQELISLIKAASVPIICMCNDRNSQKMRSLVNYCYDLRFNRPRVDQIKAAMMSVCCKEGLKVPGEALAQLIAAANQDVRQTLNLLSVWAADQQRADADSLRRDAAKTIKDVKLGPWEAVRKVFSAEDHKTMSIQDKSDLFFYDYSLAPLFVQENYIQVAPHCPTAEVLDRLSKAADGISLGDLVEARIRGAQAWNLLPVQAMYSSVIPGHTMSGHVTGQIQFPNWLGKNSRRSKMHRLCQEIHAHTRLSTSGSKSSIFLDYCTHLRDAVVTPLIKDKMDGINQSLDVLEAYHLLREDLESLTEMSLWPGQRNPMILIDSKVKAAMTRTYNKKASALPYAPGGVRRARAPAADGGADDDAPSTEADDSDPENDLLIKKRKVKENEKSSASSDASKNKPTTSKGKGKKK